MNVPQKMVFSGKKLAGYIYFDYLCRKKRIGVQCLEDRLAENNGFAEHDINRIKKIVEKYGNEFKSQYIRHIGKRVDD